MSITAKPLILAVDDEREILESIKDSLESNQFRVETALLGKEALQKALLRTPDLILLDVALPDMNGLEVCRQLRENPETADVPVIMVSARSEPGDKTVGLNIGADDYIGKPFRSMELLARVNAVLRRRAANLQVTPFQSSQIKRQNLSVDLDARSVSVGKSQVALSSTEFEVLVLLISTPGKVFHRRTLIAGVWGDASDAFPATLDTHVKNLRRKLKTAGKFLETIHGIGYRWIRED